MLVCGDFQRRRQHSATTGEWPALGMQWGTAKSDAASAVCNTSGEACTGGYGMGVVQVVCRGVRVAGLWIFPEEEAALGNHSAQSPPNV